MEIDWGDGNAESFDVGEGTPRDGGFDLEGVVGYEYSGMKSTQQKSVRATLRVQGKDGQCARVRTVTVTKGSEPDSRPGARFA